MTARDLIKYWLDTSFDDFETAKSLFKAKRFNHSLFFCHLALEKLLKGLVFKNTHKHSLPIHDLAKLAMQARLKLTREQLKQFKEINTWNIRARYDNYEREFYKKATYEFTKKWFTAVKEIITWLKDQY